jgi:pimeloyl-ACP methyl ester carboxylesterase
MADRWRVFNIWVIAVAVLLQHPVSGSGQEFFESQGIQIRYVDEGSGEPVILLHGYTGRLEGWSRAGVSDALLRDYRVIRMDARGHGESGKPHDPGAYGAEMALDVIRLMDHLGLQRAHLVGYSMGARLIGYLVAHRPESLITATFGGSPPRQKWDASEEARAARFIASVEQRGRDADPDDGQDYTALAAIPRSWSDQVVSPSALRATQVPILAIVGDEDPRLPGVTALESLIPGLILVVVEGADHGETMSRPEFAQALQQFLSAHSVGK